MKHGRGGGGKGTGLINSDSFTSTSGRGLATMGRDRTLTASPLFSILCPGAAVSHRSTALEYLGEQSLFCSPCLSGCVQAASETTHSCLPCGWGE